MPDFLIGDTPVGDGHPVYFVADISANHDGSLDRAKELIHLAAEAGASAAKFQNFRAKHIVSDYGFRALGSQVGHQAAWKRSVFEVYEAAALPWEWTPVLRETCEQAGIEYFSAPYDLEAVDMLDEWMRVYKVGSGDIAWREMLEAVARKGKPVLLATGASDIGEVQRAVDVVLALNPHLCLMQCNTNYTGSEGNFAHVHLNALTTFRTMYPEVVLGLSDHTRGDTAVLGAVALGARVIEKHFTDDNTRTGPDHPFSMTPESWSAMVHRVRDLEAALGSHRKFVTPNEAETVVVQRRGVRATRDLVVGAKLTRADIEPLRPAPAGCIEPWDLDRVVGHALARDVVAGACIMLEDLG